MPYCSICQQTVANWLPHPHPEQRSPLMTLLDTVGSDLSIFTCPSCGCNDRLRHLWLYMQATGLTAQLQGSTLLHIAPEHQLEVLLEACQPAVYVRGDLIPTQPHHHRIDIEGLSFSDASLDMVICNHVLEHVSHPEKALSEFFRCLKPGGILIAQTPYAPSIKKTFELQSPPSPDVATLLFGQADHVRLFGDDITDYFHASGFKGELLSHDSLLPGKDQPTFGCNVREPFFVFWKPNEVNAARTETHPHSQAEATAV